MGEEERKNRGGRMGEEMIGCYIKGKGASLVGALRVLQGARDTGALSVGPSPQSKGTKATGALQVYKDAYSSSPA
jgi:hypothetical protein